MGVGAVFLVLSVLAFARFSRGAELFPEGEPRMATVAVKYPEGTDIETTDATLQRIEQGLAQYGDIKFFLANAGAIVGRSKMGGGSSGTHLGSIQIEFLPFHERKGQTRDIVQKIRANIGSYPDAEIKVEVEKEGPPAGAPVSIEVAGEDFDVLKDVSERVVRDIRTVPDLVDLQDNMDDAKPEIRFRVDRERAALLGLDTATVGQFLRTAINGEEVSKFRAGEDEYDITLRVRADQRETVDIFKEIYITTSDGATVPLTSLGTYSYGPGRGLIQRKDQKRVITISGDNQGRTVAEILKDIKMRLARFQLPKGYTIKFTGENKDMDEAFTFLMQSLATALVLIAIILVMEFNSVSLPFIILFSVLLSMIGVMWSLIVCQMRFSVIMSGIGVVSLAGVVVKNGIVMIDYINRRKEKGMSSTDAIIASGRIRLRPVLMTAITAVVGLIPTAIGWSLEVHKFPPRIVSGTEMSSFWSPMAVAVIFGLSLATVLTLVQVPVMVSLWDSGMARLRKMFPRREEE
jgi:multidrug efflux pump subunit AcrB